MKYYKLLKLVSLNGIPNFIKLLGLWGLLILRKRSIGVYIDPVLSCNLRCKMCYFSDPQKRKELHGIINTQSLSDLKRLLLPYALKMQIGCGAEPTLYKDLAALISSAKSAKVPNISLTTNGQLIGSGEVDLERLINAGLDEITISLHGTTRELYEELMPGAKFENLVNLIQQLSTLKKNRGCPIIRINFTINSRNLNNLRNNNFFEIWEKYEVTPDFIQLRPVQNMGDTLWTDFDLTPLKNNYDETIGNVVKLAADKNITILYPTLASLDCVDNEQEGVSSLIEDISYCYVDPHSLYKSDFNPINDTFIKYHRRKKTCTKVFRAALFGYHSRERNTSKKLNYTVK